MEGGREKIMMLDYIMFNNLSCNSQIEITRSCSSNKTLPKTIWFGTALNVAEE